MQFPFEESAEGPSDDVLRPWGIGWSDIMPLVDKHVDSCAIVVGSVAAGLANRTSDIDIFVIGNREPYRRLMLMPSDASGVSPYLVDERSEELIVSSPIRNNARAQFSVVGWDMIKRLFDEVRVYMDHVDSWLRRDLATPQFSVLGRQTIIRLGRIVTGGVLHNKSALLNNISPADYKMLCDCAAISASFEVGLAKEDLRGLDDATSIDVETQIFCARYAVEKILALLLSLHGYPTIGDKLSFRLLSSRRFSVDAAVGSDLKLAYSTMSREKCPRLERVEELLQKACASARGRSNRFDQAHQRMHAEWENFR